MEIYFFDVENGEPWQYGTARRKEGEARVPGYISGSQFEESAEGCRCPGVHLQPFRYGWEPIYGFRRNNCRRDCPAVKFIYI